MLTEFSCSSQHLINVFFFQAEDGIRDLTVTGVQTCALPISVIYTDAARDGTLTGPDLVGARAIAALGLDVIVSGGVAWLDDLRRAADAGLAGAIVGRALHERRFTLAEALACVAG